jgi:hypothetical protein
MLIDIHNGGLVATAVAVVGGGEDSGDVLVMGELIAAVHELMGPDDNLELVVVVELLADVAAEVVAGPALGQVPAASLLGVAPEQVAHGPLGGHLDFAVQLANVVQAADVRRQAPVQAEGLRLDQRCQGQVVEQLREAFPDVHVAVLPRALVVEAVDLGDLPGFVVAAQDRDPVFVAHLERQQEGDSLHGMVPAVHIVPHKQIVGLRDPSANLEQLDQIVELAVDVAADYHGSTDWVHV